MDHKGDSGYAKSRSKSFNGLIHILFLNAVQQERVLMFKYSGISAASWYWKMVCFTDNGKIYQKVVYTQDFSLFYQQSMSLKCSLVYTILLWAVIWVLRKRLRK